MDMEDDDPAGGLTGADGKSQDPSAPLVHNLKSSGMILFTLREWIIISCYYA